MSIAEVERDTGLSKDLLRVWERRYGFPRPGRTPHGERAYSSEEVAKLRLVRRLMDMGKRPGRILLLPMEELQTLCGDAPSAERTPLHDLALYLITTHQTAELKLELRQTLMRDGLYRFVTETAAPLAALVGQAWMRGEIQIFEEHLFTEQMIGVLRGAIAQMPASGGSPRVLLTTPPQEQHALGLLMAEAVLTLEGAECVPLGTQTPVAEVAAAATAKAVDVVALSFSGNVPANQVSDYLRQLRGALPAHLQLWCGGEGATRLKQLPERVTRVDAFSGIGRALSDWRNVSGGGERSRPVPADESEASEGERNTLGAPGERG